MVIARLGPDMLRLQGYRIGAATRPHDTPSWLVVKSVALVNHGARRAHGLHGPDGRCKKARGGFVRLVCKPPRCAGLGHSHEHQVARIRVPSLHNLAFGGIIAV